MDHALRLLMARDAPLRSVFEDIVPALGCHAQEDR